MLNRVLQMSLLFYESHAYGFQGWTHNCAISRDLKKKKRKIQTSTFRICARRRVSLVPYSGAELINICINHVIEYLRNKRVLFLVCLEIQRMRKMYFCVVCRGIRNKKRMQAHPHFPSTLLENRGKIQRILPEWLTCNLKTIF